MFFFLRIGMFICLSIRLYVRLSIHPTPKAPAIFVHESRVFVAFIEHGPSGTILVEIDANFVTSVATDRTIRGHPKSVCDALTGVSKFGAFCKIRGLKL